MADANVGSDIWRVDQAMFSWESCLSQERSDLSWLFLIELQICFELDFNARKSILIDRTSFIKSTG